MREVEWVELLAERLRRLLISRNRALEVKTGLRLAYGHEIRHYGDTQPVVNTASFETDLSIIQRARDGTWRPRVIVEAKLGSVTTHDAITYSRKAEAHRTVHPYLRYGIMLGNRGPHPLPGRLFRHGTHFDFMCSFTQLAPTNHELTLAVKLLRQEVTASITLEKVLYESRLRGRDRYTILHRRLQFL